MPYITQDLRKDLDSAIEILVADIKELITGDVNYNEGKKVAKANGILNYVFTKLLLEVYEIKTKPSYEKFNEIEGVLGCCQKEFYQVHAAPYEDKKRKENGDV